MLLFSRNIGPDLRFATWETGEGEVFFSKDLPLATAELAELEKHQHPVRREEWLAGRWLLHRLTGRTERLALTKDLYSKPFFIEAPQLHCSLSHSQGIVGALLSGRNCGCDIQVLVDKMARIAPKFMREDEMAWVETNEPVHRFEMMHLFWTAKEAMYKAHGLKELDFRGHLFLQPFTWNHQEIMQTQGWIKKNDLQISYDLYMGHFQSEFKSFVWTIAVN